MTKIHQEKPKIDLFQFQIYHNHILIGLKYFTSHETWLSQPDIDKMTVLAFVKVTRCLDLTFISEYGQKTLKNSIYQLPLTNTDKKKSSKSVNYMDRICGQRNGFPSSEEHGWNVLMSTYLWPCSVHVISIHNMVLWLFLG